MSEEKKLVDDFQEGVTAYNLQEKLLLDKSFIKIKADLMIAFEDTGFKDDDERREVWRKMQTVAWLEQSLTEITNNGKIAEQELKTRGFFERLKRKTKG